MPVRSRWRTWFGCACLLFGAWAAPVCAAAPPSAYPTPLRWRAWAPALRQADSLLWAYRANDAAAAARSLRTRARAERADWPEMAACLIGAASEALLGRGAEAEPLARSAQVLARRLGDREYDRRAMRWLAFALETEGRSAAAESTYRALLRAATPARDTLHRGAAHLGLGYAALQRGELDDARRHYSRAVPLLLAARNPVLHATARVGLARTLHGLGEFAAEERIYLDILGAARRAQLGRNEVDALLNLGTIAYARGDAERAVLWWTAAVERQRAVFAGEAGAVAVSNLALALGDLGRYDEADALVDSATAAARTARQEDAVALLEMRRGEALIVRERHRGALEAFARAERALPEGRTATLARVRAGALRARAALEPPEAALAYAESELAPLADALQGIDRGELLLRLGLAQLDAGHAAAAAETFDRCARENARGGSDRSRMAVALYHRGRALRDGGRADSAVVTLRRAIGEWEAWRSGVRGTRWEELRTFPFGRIPVALADLVLGPGASTPARIASAWQELQPARARAVLDRLAGAGPERTSAPRWERLRGELLAPGDLLLDFHAGDDVTLLFAVSRTGARVMRLPGADSLARTARALHAALAAPPGAGASGAAIEGARARFAQRLLAGVTAELRAARRVIVVPDGALALAPLELLVRDVAPGAREVWRAPSVAVLARLRALPRPAVARALAWRGADDARLPSLRGADGEVAALRRRLGALDVRDGRRARSLPAEQELRRYDLLHFATHARAFEQTPWESGLLLADSAASGGEGWLTARRLARMRLPARLAFLSGCSTAGGRVVDGEGVTGLTTAFHAAGVGAVVAALWSVDDAAVARLADVFHARLAEGWSAAAALEEAREALRRDPETAHPHWWAGFVLSGDGGRGRRSAAR